LNAAKLLKCNRLNSEVFVFTERKKPRKIAGLAGVLLRSKAKFCVSKYPPETKTVADEMVEEMAVGGSIH